MRKVKLGMALFALLTSIGCGCRVGNSFVMGTPSIHKLDNERLVILNGQGQGS
jgi:hypothetical protein